MKLTRKLASILDNINCFLVALAVVSIGFIMLSVFGMLVVRRFLTLSLGWVTEVSVFCLLLMTFLGAAWVLKVGGHTRIDLLLNLLGRRSRALVNTITSVICAGVWLAITWYAVKATLYHYQLGYYLYTTLETPSFISLAIISVGSLMLFIQFLRDAHKYTGIFRVSPGKE